MIIKKKYYSFIYIHFFSFYRISTPFEAVSVILMLFATMFALIGHCNADHKTLVACGLYTLGGELKKNFSFISISYFKLEVYSFWYFKKFF